MRLGTGLPAALALLTGVLALTARILLLLSGLLAPALLLAGLLTRVLVLLLWRREPGQKLALYKRFKPHPALLPHPVPTVKKRADASFRLPGPSPRHC